MRLLLPLLWAVACLGKKHKKHDTNTSTTAEEQAITNLSNAPKAKGIQSVKEAIRGDRDFLRGLRNMRSELLVDGSERDLAWETLMATDHGPVLLTEQLAVSWLPVECKVLGLELRPQKTIHAGKRNKLQEMVDHQTGHRYAYKTFDNADEYTAELSFFMVADHPYFVKPKCIVREARRPGIVMELVKGVGNSLAYVKESGVDGTDLARLSAQLFEALSYMHWLGFVHADMKPENVMVDADGNIKVIDFGFAIPLPFGKRGRGTPSTTAPELVGAVEGEIHEAIDWWAYGSTLAMWYSVHYDGERWIPLRVKRGEPLVMSEPPGRLPSYVREVIHLCLHPDTESRRFNTAIQQSHLRSLSLFQRIDWSDIASH